MSRMTSAASTGLLMASGMVVFLAGCGDGQNVDRELLASSSTHETEAAPEPTYPVEREFWLAMAEEPRWHLDSARRFFQDGENDMASLEMAKAASILNFECRHSHSPREEGLLLGSVEELQDVARDLRTEDSETEDLVSLTEIDRVSALAFRAIAAHQVALARDALEAGDVRTAGALSRETAHALQMGFQRAGVVMDADEVTQLQQAREVGLQMQLDGEGTRDQAMDVLENLDAAVRRLSNAVTDRRQ